MFHPEQVVRMCYAEQEIGRRGAALAAEARRYRLAGQARKLRKRDGRSENAEAGGPRPPAVDC